MIAKSPVDRNILRGIVPTPGTFETNPTDLANITDGNPNNPSGVGSKSGLSATGIFGTLTFDIGSVKTVDLGGRVRLWNSNSNNSVRVYLSTSEDNTNWDEGNTYAAYWVTVAGATSNVIAAQVHFSLKRITARYINLLFFLSYSSGSPVTAYTQLYDLNATEVLL